MVKKIHVNIPYKMLVDKIDFVLERKLNPEIYFSGEALDTLRVEDVLTLQETLSRHGLSTTIHAPFMDLSPGGVDSLVKKATRDRIDQTLAVAAYFHPELVVFHPGFNKWFFDNTGALWLENSLKTWKPVAGKAEQAGIPLAVENIFEEDPASLRQLITGVNSPLFNFCFDTGHFHLFSTVPMEDWFASLGDHIREVHLHDNAKQSDDHLPMGDGEIDFIRFFELVKLHGINPLYTIEPHRVEDLERSFRRCSHFLEQV